MRFSPGERTLGTHCTEGWVGPRAGLDTEDRWKILRLCRKLNLDRPIVQSVVRHYTDWATRLTNAEKVPRNKQQSIPNRYLFTILYSSTETYETVTWHYWVSGLCPSSDALRNTFRKLNLFPSSGKTKEATILLGPIERANVNHRFIAMWTWDLTLNSLQKLDNCSTGTDGGHTNALYNKYNTEISSRFSDFSFLYNRTLVDLATLSAERKWRISVQ
jgi:hypothetical protein